MLGDIFSTILGICSTFIGGIVIFALIGGIVTFAAVLFGWNILGVIAIAFPIIAIVFVAAWLIDVITDKKGE